MRIIKEGKIPNLEYVFTCSYCECEFAVTREELFNESPYIDKNSYPCPICNTQVYGGKPQVIEEVISDSETDEPILEPETGE